MLVHSTPPVRVRPGAWKTKGLLSASKWHVSCRQGLRGSLAPCRTAAAELEALLERPPVQRIAADKPDRPSTDPAGAQAQEQFNWLQAWYPLAAVSALKTDAPNAQQLLGMRLVVWWDKNSDSWRCFEDLCPHRLAPLSEGRLHESGELQCTYHGWTFNAQGSCTSIPQLGDPKAHTTACSSSRSCVKSYPVSVHEGILWVYADSAGPSRSTSSGQQGEGHVQPPAALLPPAGYVLASPWFQRDIPLSFDILLENFLDPAHVPHSHHGVAGDRNALHTLNMTLEQPPSKDAGFAVHVAMPARWGSQDYELRFTPPALVRHSFPGVTMLLYGVPTAKGSSRVIMSFLAPEGSSATRPATPQLPAFVNMLQDVIDRVPALQHAFNRNAIMDGDSYFLHAAERVLYDRGDATSWRRQYYMPGSSDAAVIAWRKWLDDFGSNLPTLPTCAADIPPLLPREVVLDRLRQHTQVCPHCSAALKAATIAAGLMAAVAAVAAGSIVAAVVGGTAPLVSSFNGVAAVVTVLVAAAAAAMWRFRQMFIYTDYVHAEH